MRHRWSTAVVCLFAVGLACYLTAYSRSEAGQQSPQAYLPDIPNFRPTTTSTQTPSPTATMTPTPLPTATPTLASEANPYNHGTPGYDLSFPQCGGGSIPLTASNGAPYTFAVVGVTGGKAFTENSCVGSEAAAASGVGHQVSFYMNINAPIGSSASYGNYGPKGLCAPSDTICQSYNYGYNAAQYAYGWATNQVGSSGVARRVWWLDVETANSWFADTNSNDQAIQGAIDYLQQNGASAGVYSIPSMWNEGSATGSAADGAVPLASLQLWPLIAGGGFRPNVPSWTSGATSLSGAQSLCGSSSFTGNATWLVQEPNYIAPNGANYDEDYAC